MRIILTPKEWEVYQREIGQQHSEATPPMIAMLVRVLAGTKTTIEREKD